MSLDEELREEQERTQLERIKSAVREELSDQISSMESRIMKGISERSRTSQTSSSTYSCRLSEIPIQELHTSLQNVGDLMQGISVLTRSFIERFPPRPKTLARRIKKIAVEYFPYLLFAALLFLVAAMWFHWPFVFRWFGYRLDQVRYPQDVRSVFLIP